MGIGSTREVKACSTAGDDLEENEVAVGLTNSGGVSGSSVRGRDSNADSEPIWCDSLLWFQAFCRIRVINSKPLRRKKRRKARRFGVDDHLYFVGLVRVLMSPGATQVKSPCGTWSSAAGGEVFQGMKSRQLET